MELTKKDSQILDLVHNVPATEAHKIITTRLSRNQGYVVSLGQIEALARKADKSGDKATATQVRAFLADIYEAEAEAIGTALLVCARSKRFMDTAEWGGDEEFAEAVHGVDVTADQARYMLMRGVASSRLLMAPSRFNGGMEAVDGAGLFRSTLKLEGGCGWVSIESLVTGLAVCHDSGPGPLPSNKEEAEWLCGAGYDLCQPAYVRSIRRHLEDGTDASWSGLAKAHEHATDEYQSSILLRSVLDMAFGVVVNQFISEAAKALPRSFPTRGNPLMDLVRAWCPSLVGKIAFETDFYYKEVVA